MPSLIEGGPQQVVHGRVHDCEVALAGGGRRLQVFHPSEQHPGIRDEVAARLHRKAQPPLRQRRRHLGDQGRNVELALVPIAHAKAAAQVQVLKADARLGQGVHDAQQAFQRGDVGARLADLGADVAGDAEWFEGGRSRGVAIHFEGLRLRHAELVFLQASGDVGVCAGVHIRIDAHRHRRDDAEQLGPRLQAPQFAQALHVAAADAGLEREIQLRGGLADPGEHRVRRRPAAPQDPFELTARNDVEPRAQALQQAEDGEIAVGLDGVMDAPADRRQGAHEVPMPRFDDGLGIDVNRGADGFRDGA